MVTVLGTAVLLAAAPGLAGAAVSRAGTSVVGASTAAGTGAGATVHHARQCASVSHASGGTIVVPVVVDLGGSSDTAGVTCVPVPAGSNGAEVLAARATLLGTPAPRYAISGLLCAIDGYPATGCGQANGSHYAYWAYFHGGSSWTYASVGPASWTVSSGDVEGWRFEPDGSATPADPPPRSPSDAATLCPASSPPSTTTTTTPTTGSTTTSTLAPGSGATGDRGSTGSGPAPPGSHPKPAVSAGGGVTTTSPGTVTTAGTTPATTVAPPTNGVSPRASGSTGTGRPLATNLASTRQRGHGGVPVGLIVAVALIALFATGAVVRTRRSTKAE